MRLTTVFIIAAIMQVSASGFAQRVTFKAKEVSLQELFKAIKAQTGYNVVMSAEKLEAAQLISADFNNEPLERVLEASLDGQNLTYTIDQKTIVIREKVPSFLERIIDRFNAINVRGVVVDSLGNPLQGATVKVKGSSTQVNTSAKGEFYIANVDENAVLVVSYVGYVSREIKAEKDMGMIRLVMASADLEEVAVVSTGYQNIPKERATGSFVLIDSKTLNQQVGTNILQRLDGVSSGVLFEKNKANGRVNSGLNISVRGLSTINGPLDPLVVLDGFIYEGNINNINPNDVDNVTILKDAAAASIWGARAGNGVILITTKKGKLNQKLQVGFNATMTMTDKPDLFYLPQMKSSDYIDSEQMLFNNGYFDYQASTGYIALTPAVEIFLKRRDGLISKADSASQINALKGIDSRDQYLKYMYKNGLTQQYSANVRGGSNVNSYAFSMAYDNAKDNLANTSKKINLHFENTYQPIERLKVGLGVYYTNSETHSGKPGFNELQINGRQLPYLSLADENGTPLAVPITYRHDYTDTAGAGKLLDWKYYPLEEYKHSGTENQSQELYANLGLQYKILKSLNVDVKYQYQKQESINEQLSDLESYDARNQINLFSQLNRQTGVVTRIIPLGGVRKLDNTIVASHTIRGQLNFNESWGSHVVSAIAGNEIRQVGTTGNGNAAYGYNANPLSFTNVDFVNSYPTFVTGDYQPIGSNISFGDKVYRFVSYYANAAYTFKNRYIFSASGRRDGANVFGVNTNDKWKPLWSVGLAWKLSDEPFYTVAALPQLKLRTTYGYSGNVDVTRTALAVGGYFSGAQQTNYPYVTIQSVNNPDLRWEQNRTINLAIDFAFKNEVITGSIEYYIKDGRELYGLTPYDYTTTGRGGEIIKNVANTRGKGFDLVLNSRNLNEEIKWNTSLLLNYNVTKTTKYYSAAAYDLHQKLDGGSRISPVVGEPLYSIAAYRWAGLDNTGNPQGVINGEKSLDYTAIAVRGDIVSIGPSTPTTFGSLINTLQWRNLSISANVGFKLGYYFRKSSIAYGALADYGAGHKDFENRWKKPGDEQITNIPSFVYPFDGSRDGFYLNSEVNVLKADHIRLNYVNLSYSFGLLSNRRLPFKDVKIYVNVANLGILWRSNKEGLDPDYPLSLPNSRSYSFGLTSNF